MPQRKAERGFPQYIGKHYLGPGNEYPNELPPIGSSDQIAQVHDKEYSELQQNNLPIEEFDKRIRESDYRAAGEFVGGVIRELRAQNIREFGWNALGALGLGTKLAVESLVGRVYPRYKNILGKDDKNSKSSNSVSGRRVQCKRQKKWICSCYETIRESCYWFKKQLKKIYGCKSI